MCNSNSNSNSVRVRVQLQFRCQCEFQFNERIYISHHGYSDPVRSGSLPHFNVPKTPMQISLHGAARIYLASAFISIWKRACPAGRSSLRVEDFLSPTDHKGPTLRTSTRLCVPRFEESFFPARTHSAHEALSFPRKESEFLLPYGTAHSILAMVSGCPERSNNRSM